MANEKIHEYIDSVVVNDVKGNEIWIDTDTGTGSNWTSKKLDIEILAQILRTHFKVYGQYACSTKQYISSSNREQQITLDIDIASGDVQLTSNAIVVPEDGQYRVQYILMVANSGGTHSHLDSWMKIDGQNVAYSRKQADSHSNQSGSPLVNEMILQMGANSQLTFWMSSPNTNVLLNHEASSIDVPMMPSILVTIEKI